MTNGSNGETALINSALSSNQSPNLCTFGTLVIEHLDPLGWKSVGLQYKPVSEPLHISVKLLTTLHLLVQVTARARVGEALAAGYLEVL